MKNILDKNAINYASKHPVQYMWEMDIDINGLPISLQDGFARWFLFGIPAGSFLDAVIRNDLTNAVIKADYQNINRLPDVVRWMVSTHDISCCLDRNVEDWKLNKGWFGMKNLYDDAEFEPKESEE